MRRGAESGETSAANLLLLCTGHHAAVHEGRLVVRVREGKLVFENAHGLQLRSAAMRDIDTDVDAARAWLHAAIHVGMARGSTSTL